MSPARWRPDAAEVDHHRPPSSEAARAGLSHTVELPIDIEDVRIIASEGFPLWEPVEVMVQRNRRITLAYADLSRRLADVVADGGHRDANWCTFATWSSKTIGTWIESIPLDDASADPSVAPSPATDPESSGPAGPVPAVRRPPTWPNTFATVKALGRLGEQVGLGPVVGVVRGMTDRGRAASYRALATGNRAVFLEIGLAVATFLEHFPKRSAALGTDADDQWTTCWDRVSTQLDELSLLDPSWLLTDPPPPEELRHGLHQYFKALGADDPSLRAQHVLAGNLLVAAYEQRRVQGYVCAALALFTDRAMQGLIRDRTGAVDGLLEWPSQMFARYVTRHMVLRLVDEPLWLCNPLRPPTDPGDRWDSLATNADVTLPLLQVLITRYQLAVGRYPNRGATDWTCFDQRMRTIGNLFRLRQHQRSLFDSPFTPTESDLLLAPHP